MERRRAIAWAGSIALAGFVVAFTVGSLAGGFGLGVSRTPPAQTITPQPITPEPKPGDGGDEPAPGAQAAAPPSGGVEVQPAPGGAGGAQLGPQGWAPSAWSAPGTLSADPPVGRATSPVEVPMSRTAPKVSASDVAAPPRDLGKRGGTAGLDKAPSSHLDPGDRLAGRNSRRGGSGQAAVPVSPRGDKQGSWDTPRGDLGLLLKQARPSKARASGESGAGRSASPSNRMRSGATPPVAADRDAHGKQDRS